MLLVYPILLTNLALPRWARQEYWSGLLFPSPGDLPNAGLKPGSPSLQADSLPTELLGIIKVYSWAKKRGVQTESSTDMYTLPYVKERTAVWAQGPQAGVVTA